MDRNYFIYLLEQLGKADIKTLIKLIVIEAIDRGFIAIQNLDCDDDVFDKRHFFSIIKNEELNDIEKHLFSPLFNKELVSTVEFNFHITKYFGSTSSYIEEYKLVKNSLIHLSDQGFITKSKILFWTNYKLNSSVDSSLLNKVSFDIDKYPELFEEIYPLEISKLEFGGMQYLRKGNYPKPMAKSGEDTVPNNS